MVLLCHLMLVAVKKKNHPAFFFLTVQALDNTSLTVSLYAFQTQGVITGSTWDVVIVQAF